MLEPEKAGDFIGKSALRRIKDEGVAQRLVALQMTGDPLPSGAFQDRWPVFDGDEKIGEVTGAVHSASSGEEHWIRDAEDCLR